MPKECCKETCEKIPNDEPVFVLRGKDELAPIAIQQWIQDAKRNQVNPDKIASAEAHLRDMLQFQRENPMRTKIPD